MRSHCERNSCRCNKRQPIRKSGKIAALELCVRQLPEMISTNQFTAEDTMPQWTIALFVVLMAVTATSSTYTAYKVYQMTDAKPAPIKGKR